MDNHTIESTIFFTNRVFVYDLRNAKNPEHGYRAADYSSTQHMWAGMLKINSGQDTHTLLLEHDPHDNGKSGIFAQCQIKPGVITEALDSSRYFVIRIDNESTGQFIMLLIGFANKNHAFDFRHELASLSQRDKEVLVDNTDYTLKEKTITLDVNALRGKAPKVTDQVAPRPLHNIDKVSLSGSTAPVRGRRTNNNPSTSSHVQQQQQPQQQQQQQPQEPQQQQQQPPQQQQQQQTQSQQYPRQAQQTTVDIFASMKLSPTSQPQPKPQQQQQQQQASSSTTSDPFDIFAAANASAVITKKPTSTTTPAQAAVTTKSSDPFDFADFDF